MLLLQVQVYYSDEFSKVKCAAESINIHFFSDNNEEYNEVFTLAELKCALSSTSDTSPGPDKIHNLMFTLCLCAVLYCVCRIRS